MAACRHCVALLVSVFHATRYHCCFPRVHAVWRHTTHHYNTCVHSLRAMGWLPFVPHGKRTRTLRQRTWPVRFTLPIPLYYLPAVHAYRLCTLSSVNLFSRSRHHLARARTLARHLTYARAVACMPTRCRPRRTSSPFRLPASPPTIGQFLYAAFGDLPPRPPAHTYARTLTDNGWLPRL